MLKSLTCGACRPVGEPLAECFRLESLAQAVGLQDERLQALQPPRLLAPDPDPAVKFRHAPAFDQLLLLVETLSFSSIAGRYRVRAEGSAILAATAEFVLVRNPGHA